MSQTTVSLKPAIALDGQLADSSMIKHVDSFVNAEVSAEISFGKMVVAGTNPYEALLPHTSAAVSAPLIVGVSMHSFRYDETHELGDVGIKPKARVDVLTIGRIRVIPEEAVVRGGAVRFRAVAAGNEVAGSFRTTADGTDCVDISSFARWVEGGNTTTPALLEINMTMAALAVADT